MHIGSRSHMSAPRAGEASVPRLAVTRLSLTDFRSYPSVRIRTDSRPVVLTGPNGAGKTNILEALSFLAPGRGLRRARLAEITRRRPDEATGDRAWGVAAKLEIGDSTYDVGTGCRPDADGGREKREVKIDGESAKSQGDLGRLTAVQWLTPQMDGLFNEGAGGRRRFVDRIIYGLDGDHAGPVNAYDHALRSRNKLLREGVRDTDWLASVEDSMVRHGVAVAARRREAVARLSAHCRVGDGPFPDAEIAMTGDLEAWLDEAPALEVEDRFREQLRENGARDSEQAGAGVGPHRSDLAVRHAGHGRPAAECSTGEQKGLLITLVLGSARMQSEDRGFAPLLLLDEVAAHLDETRRAALFGRLGALNAQAWMTGTDAGMFEAWRGTAQFFDVSPGSITECG